MALSWSPVRLLLSLIKIFRDRKRDKIEDERRFKTLFRKVISLNDQYKKLRGKEKCAKELLDADRDDARMKMNDIVPQLIKEYNSLIDELQINDRKFNTLEFYENCAESIDSKLKELEKVLNNKKLKHIPNNSIFRIATTVLVIIVAVLLYLNRKYVFPYLGYDEYCEKKYKDIIIIHNKNCPICKECDFWFTKKENKYNLIIKKNACFCTECFTTDEIGMLKVIHLYNLLQFERNLNINGASKEYIKIKVKYNYKSQRELDCL